ncbi:Anthranilate synthase component II [Apostasia shenzhenica]|uniref:p-aminobenzoic acid synthase n=1 Tax=Apostasia shenzhenica TaxID=1088818 RepID=A0A2I0APP0_9ASPA|nr:Anthranilate synthase component II [Apostasia shenzhenica]
MPSRFWASYHSFTYTSTQAMATRLRIQSPSPLSRVATKVSVSRQHSDSSLSSPKLSLISRFPTFHKGLHACSFASQSTSSAIYVKRAAGLQSNDDHDEKDDEMRAVRTLLIDNYDSYTYNIYQELAVVNRVPPVVIHNDEWSWEDIHHILYNENAFDNIVISPGPGSPACPKDIGVCLQILSHCADIPVLGVCLGHQALGYVYGAKVVHAPEPIHGRLSEIVHDGCNLFFGIPSGKKAGFKVMRYHSLVIAAESLPRELIPIAWTASAKTHSLSEAEQSEVLPGLELQGNKLLQFGNLLATPELAGSADVEMSNIVDNDKILMGVMHSSKPHYGVQFHPESIATSHRRQIFENFKRMTADYGLRSSLHPLMKAPCTPRSYKEFPMTKLLHDEAIISNQKSLCAKYLKLQWKKIDCLAGQVDGPENIFCSLFGDKNAQNTFWLDSSSTDKGRARFSFMGGKGGPLWKQITFHISEKRPGGRISIQDTHGQVKTEFSSGGFFHFLDKVFFLFCIYFYGQ